MSDSHQPENIAANNENSLKALVRAIRLSQGQFRLILARCNYGALRDRIVQRLQELSPVKIREIVLPKFVKSLYTTIKAELGDEVPPALMVFGLESVSDLKTVLTSSNYIREEFSNNFRFPLVLWINDDVLKKLLRLTPDLESWATSVEFQLTTDELVKFFQQEVDFLFIPVLDVRADQFVGNTSLNFGIGGDKYCELKSAFNQLQDRGYSDPVVEAFEQFILGQDAYVNNQMEQAQVYYQQCVQGLQKTNRLEMAAKFINAWAEVLQQLERWDELEVVARQAVKLHQTFMNSLRLARAYGFLAEVALKREEWEQAQEYAKKALAENGQSLESPIIETIEESSRQKGGTDERLARQLKIDSSWCLLLLAQAQQHLKAPHPLDNAFMSLQRAKAKCKPEYHPQQYLRILKVLRSHLLEEQRYVEAFNTKLEQRQIEQQYGFRSFIGAGRLESQRQAIKINPALGLTGDDDLSQATIAQEIIASDREPDVKRLIERISSSHYKLTVIYGPSGVGKSSLLTAGLIPALDEKGSIDSRNPCPIIIREYKNSIDALNQSLEEDLKAQTLQISNLPALLEYLQNNNNRNLLTVLIFDQFEEFFFNCPKPADRELFWKFLSGYLNIPFVNIILSLREDYLHNLLEYDRLAIKNNNKNDLLNKNILNNEFRYYLGNFSSKTAKNLIQSLTQRSFSLEPELIEQLVQDLAGEGGEVLPIDLQVVGAQLETDQITTLEQYRKQGNKEKLVDRYLEEVIKDCGKDKEQLADLVLYLLIDDKKNTRSSKTRSELAATLKALAVDLEIERLNDILEVLSQSGLVFRLPQFPADRYQLVHDYLVYFIRQRRGKELIAQLEEEKTKRRKNEAELAQLNHVLKRRLQIAYRGIGGLGLAILGIIGWGFWRESVINQTNAELKMQISRSKKLLASNRKFDALLENLKVGSQLKQTRWVEADTTIQMVAALQQAVDGVREYNTLEKHTGAVNSVSFSPDGQKIVSASDDNTIKLWNIQGRELQTLTGHEDKVNSVSFSFDGKMIASGSKDGTIKLWNLQGKEFQFKKQFPENRDQEFSQERDKVQDNVYSVSFSPDGQIIASASAWGIVNLWKLQGEKLPSPNQHRPYSVSFSPDRQLLASVGEDSTVQLWTVQLWDLKSNTIRILNKHKNKVNSVSFRPDGQILASASQDGTVKLWNLDGKELKTFKGHTDAVNSVSFSPDGQRLASASQDGTIKLWNLDGKEPETFTGHTDVVNSVSFRPDGQILASASSDKTVKLWHLQLREPQTRQKQENLNLDDLLRRGCDLLKDYLATHPKTLQDLPVCQSQPSALP